MKVAGNATLHAPVEPVYAALQRPRRAGPHHPRLRARSSRSATDAYRMTVTAGVASIKGTYVGDVRLHRPARPPRRSPCRPPVPARRAPSPPTCRSPSPPTTDGTTRLHYDADAVVGGMIGGVGQRLLTGVAKRPPASSSPRSTRCCIGGGVEVRPRRPPASTRRAPRAAGVGDGASAGPSRRRRGRATRVHRPRAARRRRRSPAASSPPAWPCGAADRPARRPRRRLPGPPGPGR